MINICVVSPGFLVVPSEHSGAIEVLIENLLDDNELEGKYRFDVISIDGECKSVQNKYKYSNFLYIKPSFFDKICSIFYNRIKKYIFRNPEDYISPYSVAVKRIVKRKRYDHILIENNLTVVNSLKKYKNLYFHLHNDVFGTDKPKFQCSLALSACQKVIVVSNYLKDRLVSLGHKDKVAVLYNCVDLHSFNCKEAPLQFKTFLYSGRLVPEKGVLELIKAFKNVASSDCKLLIVGKSVFGGDEATAYESLLLEEANKCNSISFAGFIPHDKMPDVLLKADCVVIPTMNEEPFGVVALEAMAMQRMIISTDSGELPIILADGCGIIVDKTNAVDGLESAISYVINQQDECRKMAALAYHKVFSNESLHKENYLRNLERIMFYENRLI